MDLRALFITLEVISPMKAHLRFFVLTLVLATPLAAHAEDSMLRVACEGDAVGAEVSINGTFRGECPVDIQVAPGKLKLQVVKDLDALHVGVFEQEIRMGEGIVKKVEVVLENRLNAEGQRQEAILAPIRAEEDAQWQRALDKATQSAMQAYLEKYPQGRYVEQARQKYKEYGQILRSKLPFKIPDNVWRTLESSEAYRNFPRARPVTFNYNRIYETTDKIYFSNTDQILPLDDHFSMEKCHNNYGGQTNYRCGLIYLGTSNDDGSMGQVTTSIDELKGSLFPLHIGSKMSYIIQVSYMSNKYIKDVSHEVVGQRPASDLDPRLTGTAWKLRTIKTDTFGSADGDDYYLEDLGFLLSSHNSYNKDEKSWNFLKLGHRNTTIFSDHYSTTTIYTRFDWTVDE